MSYCRYCGVEISYKRSKNEKWIPCNLYTGEPHFCTKTNNNIQKESGLKVCKECGKPVFEAKEGRKKIIYDYSTLNLHECKKADVTRFKKYQQKNKR